MTSAAKYMSTSDEYFANGNTFDPKRWIKEKNEHKICNPYASLPFGYGARMCIGRRIAEQEIYLIITKVFKPFTFI